MIKKVFWLWLIILIVINVIPIGNGNSKSMSGNKIFSFRLDYLIHANMILLFAPIWVLGKLRKVKWFAEYEVLKYCGIVLLAGICLELLQLLVPWRTFNPTDMIYNLGGTGLVIGFVVVSNRLRAE